MRQQNTGQTGKIRSIFKKILNFLHIFEDERLFAPTGDALHLGVVSLTDQDDAPSLVLRLPGKLADTVNVRAHGTHDFRSALLQPLQRFPRLAVGADEHGLPCSCLLGRGDKAHTARFDLMHNACVMHDAAEHCAAARRCRFLRKLHRALHAIAKAGGLSQDDFHSGAPPTCCPPRAYARRSISSAMACSSSDVPRRPVTSGVYGSPKMMRVL